MKLKRRDLLDIKTYPGYVRQEQLNSNGDWVLVANSPFTCTDIRGSIHTINYDDQKRTGNVKRTRKCLHTTEYVTGGAADDTHHMSGNYSSRYVCKYCNAYNPVPLLVPNDLANAHAEALAFFKAGCTNKEFDLATDILEWRQVKSLLPSAIDSAKSLLKALRKKNFKGTMVELANYHLTWAFGVQPLISDLEGIFKVLTSFEEKVAWLRKNQGKPVKIAFRKDLSTVLRPADSVSDNGVSAVVTEKFTEFRCMYHAYALAVYDVSALSDLELKLRVLSRSFGLDQPISVMWERIPYSFVIDWVLKVGDLLEALAPTVTLPIRFLDLGYTVKMSEGRCYTVARKYPYKGSTGIYTWYMRRTLFYREPGLPISFSLATGDPGANQLALAMSLAIQRFR